MPEEGWAEVDTPFTLPDGVTIYPTDVESLALNVQRGPVESAVVDVRMKPGRGRDHKIEVPKAIDPNAFLHDLFDRMQAHGR